MSDVPEGYRMSEVGVIPEGWEEERLGKECELITKGTTPTSLGKEFKDDGINFIKIESLEENGTIIKEKVTFIDEETNKLLKRSQLKENDVLVSIAGALGRIAIVKAEILPANTNQALAIVRLKPQTKLNRNYLFYFLNSARIKKHIDAINVQAAQANLSLENINDFTIFIPSLPEQQAIASALSDADALIQSLERLIAKKRDIKQGAMQELLTGKKRLPGFEKKKCYKQTEVGVIPADWELDYIENLTQINTGSKNTQDNVEDGQYPFFVRSQTVEGINSYSFDGEAILTAGDGVGTGKIFHYINGKFDVHQRVYRMTNFNPCIDGYYFYLYFNQNFYNRIMQMTAKSSVDSVRREMIAKMQIPIPTLTEQTAIATALSDMDAEIAVLDSKLAKARQIKEGMMQELLTGRIRLI